GAANATINREDAALKRMFQLGNICTQSKVAQVPYIPMLSEDKIRKGFFEHDMFQNLMKHLPDYVRPVVFFGYCCGWRKEEILSLKWEQVDLNQGIVRLEPGEAKNREGRTVYMEDELLQILNERHRKRVPRCPYV